MDQKIKTSLGTIVLIIIAFTAGLFIWHYEKNHPIDETQISQPLRKNKPSSPIACTEEAKACPDGSYVSRTGPNCEFAPCSTESKPDIIGGQCNYDSIAGTCKILSTTQDTDIEIVFTSTDPLPKTPLAKNLNGKHVESLGIFNEQNISLKTGDEITCEARLIIKGTCTPTIFKFTKHDTFANNWKTFRNEKLGFEFNYPGKYIEINSDDTTVNLHKDCSGLKDDDLGIRMICDLESNVSIGITAKKIDEIIDEYKGDCQADGHCFIFISSQENYTLDGVLGKKLIGTNASGAGALNYIYATKDNKNYMISFTQFGNVYSKILSTFKFIK
jgi:hypothetical protein